MELRPGGRYCQICRKTLVDFAGMTRAQAQARLKLVRGSKICARVAVHPDSGEVVFRPDPHRTARWAGGVVLAAALSSSGCGREEPSRILVEPEVAAVAQPPMMPIEHWTPVVETAPVTRAVPSAELEPEPAGTTPTTEQRMLTERKRAPAYPRNLMILGDMSY